MSDALGGLVNIGMIVFFITIIALYMAFSVNYQKAFNVKNEIIARYEEYNGYCLSDSSCVDKIASYENKLGYKNVPLTKKYTDENCNSDLGFCVRGIEAKKTSETDSVQNNSYKYCYFDVRTLVFIDIPFINYFLNLKIFQVSGQTRALKIEDGDSCSAIANAG